MHEFDLIARFFSRPSPRAVLGVGDDCALLAPKPGMLWAVSTDMLVQGEHFFPGVAPDTLGHKALAVNLSDLAACGAQPVAFTLALALPQVDESWLQGFSEGLYALADEHGCELVGGDTTRGPMTISITVFGQVPPGHALLRSGAKPGDDIYVSGNLGDARLALQALREPRAVPPALLQRARQRLEMPSPRVALGLALRTIASAAIDVSDGLLGDLGHLLQASRVGAIIQTNLAIDLLASRDALKSESEGESVKGLFSHEEQLSYVLAGGDDYELVFTAPPNARPAVLAAAAQSGTPVTCIGHICAAPGLQLIDAQGQSMPNRFASFNHFAPA